MCRQQSRVHVGSDRVNVVQHQDLQDRYAHEQLRQHAILEQVRDLEPVAHGVQALQRHIVRIIARPRRSAAPTR